ncbi:hypothetical protein, partial [Methylobacterium ajmalii]|uniref:hypothetical protein n=1 Tax=Methylobacterium ajmalii TaxID=2738439 RepID=UPI001AED1A62
PRRGGRPCQNQACEDEAGHARVPVRPTGHPSQCPSSSAPDSTMPTAPIAVPVRSNSIRSRDGSRRPRG